MSTVFLLIFLAVILVSSIVTAIIIEAITRYCERRNTNKRLRNLLARLENPAVNRK